MRDGTLLTWKKPDQGDPLIGTLEKLAISTKKIKVVITIEQEIEEIIRQYEESLMKSEVR